MSLLAQVALTRGSFSLDVNLELEPGRTVALIGPNGSGKSTLVEALAGLLPLASGEIRLDGDILESPAAGVRLPPQKRPIGVLFQGLCPRVLFKLLQKLAHDFYQVRQPRAPIGVLRDKGMCECTGAQTDSKPRSSSACASACGVIE